MNQFFLGAYKYTLLLWPLVVTLWAVFYRRKQNGMNPWTGGPISWPKSFWLSYTVQTWFFLPILFMFHSDTAHFLKIIIGFHLLSWWIRGSLELVMIYKWFNWSPRYGISHDLFHLIGCFLLLNHFRDEFALLQFGTQSFVVAIYVGMIFVSTIAEVAFAFLFLQMRTVQELRDNVYFASDDPKWVFVNRITLLVVVIVFTHLFYQSVYALKYF